jgi:hypothetical protein
MQATARKIRKTKVKLGTAKKKKLDVYADAWFTKKQTVSRSKLQQEHKSTQE